MIRANGAPTVSVSASPTTPRAAPASFSLTASASDPDGIASVQWFGTSVTPNPTGTTYAWSGLSYQERLASGQTLSLYLISLLVIFLCLAALYESWSVPFSVLLVIPLGIVGASLGGMIAQTMAIANVQKELLAGGKINLVGDRQLYNTAAELTRIMGHRNPDQFFNDPMAVNPQTGQLLHPPPAPIWSTSVQGSPR